MKGGKRPNAGRKAGGKNKATLEQKAVAEVYNQRVMQSADKLFNAQLSLAVGSVRIFRVDEEEIDGKVKRINVLVTDVDEMKEVLDAEGGQVGESFYFISNIPPDNKAIDSMLNRALGKPKETLDIGNKDDKPFQMTNTVTIQGVEGKPKPDDSTGTDNSGS